jgi:dienelactone hydrolase
VVALLLAAFPALARAADSDNVTAARAFVQTVAKEDFAAAVKTFDETMTKAMPAEKLGATWKQIVGQAGAFQKQLGTRTETKGEYETVIVACEFEKAKLDVRVVFDKEGHIAGLFVQPAKGNYEFKPPPYARPDTFTEKSVVVGEGGDWPLPGTLSLPKGDGPFPAVVLVHGSGPHDRDETIGPNKPFRDLAWGLASQGVAVLRYEKRTHEHPTKLIAVRDKLTVQEESIDDAVAAVALLRKQKEIDGKRVFVVGHSLGAIVAPRIGSQEPSVAGLVLLSGSPRPLEDIILEQVTYIISLKGEPSDEDKSELDKLRQQVARVKDPKLTAETPRSDLPLKVPAAYWLGLRAYDVGATAAKFDRPILVLQGERDYQITMADFAAWRKALDGRPNVRFKSYAKLNHLYLEGEGKSTPAEYEKPGHVSAEVIDDIAAWVKKK